MSASCETCRFGHVLWRKGDKYTYFSESRYSEVEGERYSTSIECRRYAPRGPVINTTDAIGYDAFPSVSADAWCGEYDQRHEDTF